MTPAPLLLLALGLLLASIAAGVRFPRSWLALTCSGALALLGAAAVVLLGPRSWAWRGTEVGGEPLHLHLDALSAMFLALTAVVGGAGAAYSRSYFSDRDHPAAAPRGRAWWSAMLLCLALVLTSANGLHFLIAWELFTVCAYFLITLERERAAVRATGWLYLASSHVAAVALFAFFSSLAARTGTWDLGPLRGRADLAPLFWLALFGFSVKAGVFPLHVWLPSAHANAPSHVSALLSGVSIKLGIYGLMRFSGWLAVPAAAGWVVIALGASSALVGIVFALAQNDVKRLLAYCSVENVGIVLVGLGGALLAQSGGGQAWGRLALAGALLHVWNHGAFKALLFLGAGSVVHATGTRELSRLGGLWRVMPWTAGLFVVGSLAVAGLPPLNGFVSEWLISLGLLDAVASGEPSAWAAMPAALALGLAGALALAAALKVGALAFLGAPRTRAAAQARECDRWMRAPMLVLAGACLALGLAPALLEPVLSRAVGSWEPAWTSEEVLAPVRTLGMVHLALAASAVVAAVTLRSWVGARGLRRGPTWDCGYAAPSARMQYTSGSFGELAGGWFAWILRPERRLRRPRGPFPSGALHLERVPDTVLERLLVPASTALLRVSTAVRRLQHGRLPAYILYIVAGLAALGALVALGSRP